MYQKSLYIVLLSVTFFLTAIVNLNPLYWIPLLVSQGLTAFVGVRLAKR